ncbi:hypothetical protein [Adlercreutzia caecimuris]|uniref:hypothetical protein n=1 Tax=Adlercreutzia caecimuris TaxID=671266 RepID=UPI001C3EE9CF|nr:hypothetical protein [Adlercreutzia caecimuris]
MSAFGDMVAKDVEAVFLDPDFFASDHQIAGRIVRCVVESDGEARKRPELGLSSAHATVHAMSADLADMEFPAGGTVLVDGDVWVVDSCDIEAGMTVISLSRNE